MLHYSRLSKIVIDVPPRDHDRELGFWSAAAGQPLAQFSRLIQRLDQGPARVHCPGLCPSDRLVPRGCSVAEGSSGFPGPVG